jgi:hypothetical protein
MAGPQATPHDFVPNRHAAHTVSDTVKIPGAGEKVELVISVSAATPVALVMEDKDGNDVAVAITYQVAGTYHERGFYTKVKDTGTTKAQLVPANTVVVKYVGE